MTTTARRIISTVVACAVAITLGAASAAPATAATVPAVPKCETVWRNFRWQTDCSRADAYVAVAKAANAKTALPMQMAEISVLGGYIGKYPNVAATLSAMVSGQMRNRTCIRDGLLTILAMKSTSAEGKRALDIMTSAPGWLTKRGLVRNSVLYFTGLNQVVDAVKLDYAKVAGAAISAGTSAQVASYTATYFQLCW